LARHTKLCCECYVGDGHERAEWHSECMAAARR
jgi:hypothetical protein